MKLIEPPDLPVSLSERFRRVAAQLAEVHADLPPELEAQAARVATVSEFVVSVLARRAPTLLARLTDRAALDPGELAARLDVRGSTEADAMMRLRLVRHVEMARLAWRDLAGLCTVEQSLADLSALADALIRSALEHAAERLEPRYGRPVDDSGAPAPLLVLAMGKLGGRELNFSSDVDLVFLRLDGVRFDGGREADSEEYFRRIAQALIRMLDHATDDGFALRVDTRLRPFGQSGPLVVGLGAFEAYLVQHARDWERYAYVKARLLTGEAHAPSVFEEILTPYVYRRYLDYGVFDALRQMKQLIEQEVARKEMADHVKLGPGGIREIEFIVQAYQLVRGGRDRRLRTPSLLEALPHIATERELGAAGVERLGAAYRYLRTVENRLQAMDDCQTHVLPVDPEARARLAYAQGEPDWAAFTARLAAHREAVEREFERIAWDGRGSRGAAGDNGDAAYQIWEAGDIGAVLEGTPLEGNEDVLRQLDALRTGSLYQRMDEQSRRRLAAVVLGTIPPLARTPDPGESLRRVLSVYQAVGRRSAYLALLNENAAALDRLVSLASQSAMLARRIAEHPLLLDELLDARILERPPSREELAEMLDRRVERAGPDVEARLEAMREFQRTAVFRVAIADRLGHLPLMKVSDRLTDIAELVLEFALETAWRELVGKHGVPLYGEPPELREAGFAVIGYGKLGGLELGYASDLDLVFLHDSAGSHQETSGPAAIDNTRFFSRLVQRLLHFLTIQTSSGRLYEVDTRLRPSGGKGLMVSSVESFRRYQRTEAWVWEHQALLRSRPLAGSRSIRAAFERERKEILVRHVARDRLKDEIAKMRARMRAELSEGGPGRFDLKQDPGGIADIEFLVDYLVLRHAAEFPGLVEYPDNIRQIEGLAAVGLLEPTRAEGLKGAYLALRQRVHELALAERGRVVDAAELADVRAFVTRCWEEVLG